MRKLLHLFLAFILVSMTFAGGIKVNAEESDSIVGYWKLVEIAGEKNVMSREDLELFKLLITVSGVGPKGGLALLSVGTADDLRFAIMTGDAKMIARAPGVGKKTAERLILDLRDKVAGMYDAAMMAAAGSLEGTAVPDFVPAAGTGSADSASAEAVEALTALGYSRAEAAKAVRACRDHAAENGVDVQDTESILKAALRYL